MRLSIAHTKVISPINCYGKRKVEAQNRLDCPHIAKRRYKRAIADAYPPRTSTPTSANDSAHLQGEVARLRPIHYASSGSASWAAAGKILSHELSIRSQ